ncbi:MAG: hypothetical protein RLZZ437_1620, partial [Pseudomonadota bacterium]
HVNISKQFIDIATMLGGARQQIVL